MQEKDTTFYKILPNGLKIVHRMSTSEVAYVGIMVGAGTRDEEPTLNGLAHYVEHTVFKGCLTPRGENISARQIISKIEGIGGEINAYTTKEETTFYAATPAAHYAQTLQLLADMVLRPTFPKQETDKELGVILDEIESYEDSPSELIYDDFENLIFHGHPMGMSILGTKKTLHNISRTPTHALGWVENNYTTDRMVVFSQGRMSFDSVCHQIEKAFESAISRKPLVSRSCRQAVEFVAPTTQTFKRHTHQMHVMLGGLAYPLGHEKQLGAYLLNNILGGGSLNSRLNLSLREQKGLVYTVESQYVPLPLVLTRSRRAPPLPPDKPALRSEPPAFPFPLDRSAVRVHSFLQTQSGSRRVPFPFVLTKQQFVTLPLALSALPRERPLPQSPVRLL